MTTYPVHYAVVPPGRFTRLQLAARLIAFCALGVIGISFGAVFVFAYLALPVFAASRLAARGEPRAYTEQEGPQVIRALRWFAAISAWVGLITEHLPGRTPDEVISLEVVGHATPTARSVLWRVVTGLPSAFALCLLSWLGVFVWIWAAFSILFTQRVGDGAFHYLVGLQRWSLRLLVFQAGLVDDYPPFSLSDTATELPPARVAPGA